MFPFWSECHDDGELEEGNLITGYGQLVLLGPKVELGKVPIHWPAETTTAIRLQPAGLQPSIQIPLQRLWPV